MLGLINLPQASTVAENFDSFYGFVFYLTFISFLITVAALVYFVLRYHRRKSDPKKTPYIEGHPVFEGSVMIVLFVAVMIIFYWGWVDYKTIKTFPKDALEISVVGQTWRWNFEYPNGRIGESVKIDGMARADGTPLEGVELVVPKGRSVKLVMTSKDVIHSFYVPAFRIKQDVVPNTYTSMWFKATKTGSYDVFCAEYCGLDHSMMLARVRVVEPEDYDRWQKVWEWSKQTGISTAQAKESNQEVASTQPVGSPKVVQPSSPNVEVSAVERGKKTFSEKGCTACHSVTGSLLVGPTLKGVFGHEVELEGGKKVIADENYLRESITEPQAKVVKGFSPLMPTYKGTLTDDEINALVAYVKSLSN